jgi:hypothetical protein
MELSCESAFDFSAHQRKPPEELHLGERLQGGFCPLRAASLQILESSTVTLSLARLPECQTTALILDIPSSQAARNRLNLLYRSALRTFGPQTSLRFLLDQSY